MKVNFILPFKRMSGGIRVIYIYANYLIEQGHDVCCYLPMLSYKGKKQSAIFRFKASISNTIKKEKWFDCKFTIKVVPLINNIFIRNADVVIATAWQTAYDVAKLSNSKGRKFYFVQAYEVFNGEVSAVEGTYKLGIPMITITKELKKQLEKFSDSVEVVYNGLFDNEYIKGNKKRHNKFSIMLLYHEAEYKGTAEGLEVINKLEQEGYDIQVNIFGRKVNTKFPSNYKVYQDPEREQLIKLYQESDVYLFTSTIEAWGLPVVEAMANKCVVIGRRIGALNELFDGKNAIIVDNMFEMYEEIKRLYKDKLEMETIQNNAYKTVVEFNWSISANRFLRIINR